MPASILVIEDNETNLRLLVYLLEAYGYVPLTAMDGQSGLEIAQSEPVDLIICDLEMPKVDGYEVSKRLKAHPELKTIPVVAVSAFAMVGDRDRILAAGFDGYIAKPINPETFVHQIADFLPAEKRLDRPTDLSTAMPSPALPGPRNGWTILVVDDCDPNLSFIRQTLEPSGYNVLAAKSVMQGMDLAHKNGCDLILSDMHIPHQDGLDFLRSVKNDPKLRSIPFLIVSSSGPSSAEHESAIALGVEKFMRRPMEPEELLLTIGKYLRPAAQV